MPKPVIWSMANAEMVQEVSESGTWLVNTAWPLGLHQVVKEVVKKEIG